MRPLAHRPTSFLTSLEEAKSLYQQERYQIAGDRFAEIAKAASRAAADLWLEAQFGAADCQRLARDFESATKAFRGVLARRAQTRNQDGRYAESNRWCVVYSFLSLVEMGRLSLRVPSPVLDDLLQEGLEWAEHEIGSALVAGHFRLSSLMLARNTADPLHLVTALDALLQDVRTARPARGPDPVILEVRLAEARLLAGLRVKPPSPSPEGHWARSWSFVMNRILRATVDAREGGHRAALRLLLDLEEHRGLDTYPELRLPTLRAAALASCGTSAHRELLRLYRDAAARGLVEARGRAGDSSTPLHHLAQFVLLRMDGATSRSGRRAQDVELRALDLSRELPLLFETLRDQPGIREVLASRGMSRGESDSTLRWCSCPPGGSEWKRDGEALLQRLARAVLP